jgi:hypothetical protein
MPTYRYLVVPHDVTATITADDGNDPQPITYEGANAAIVQTRLSMAYGAFGHGFSPDEDTAIDLHYALMSSYPGMVEEIGDPLGEYDTGLPDGVQT